jgi:hypothetical protein
MDRPKLEVADVFRRYGEAYCQKHGASLSMAQRRVMTAIELCRTAVLGGHLEQCDQCGHQRNAYNSCSDRHCPKCQSLARARWLEDRQSELLDTQYFHVVFTVPERIATIAYQNKRELYGILFRANGADLAHHRRHEFAKILDIYMLVFLRGKERTPTEWKELLHAAGFQLTRVVSTPSFAHVVEAVRINR